MTAEEINQSYQDFQEELASRELHLKLLSSFNDEPMDDLFDLLNELKESTPIFNNKPETHS